MKKKLRIIFVWILVSLIFQFGGYSLLDNQIQKVIGPLGESVPPVTSQLKATIPGSDLKKIQVSYAKDYLAYLENGILKVFNLKKGNVVFEKKSPSATDQTLGVLTYQWLPDRNILLYFYAKKNPNEVTNAKVYPPKAKTLPPLLESQAEDPNHAKTVHEEVPLEPRIEKRYGNPQITELYSLEFPNSDEDSAPDDRLNPFDPVSDNEKISAGGKIEKFVVSTSTNLMYLTVKKGSTQQLMEIDVMKKMSALNKSGELIDNIATSDRYGTLYIDSKMGGIQQVVALNNQKRQVISKNSNDRILGVRKGKVYIGEVKNNELVKIKTTDDLQVVKETPFLKTEWEGSLLINKDDRILIGVTGQLIVYDNQTANIIKDGHLVDIKLHGDENFVSFDGVELIQLTKEGTSTLVELRPLEL